MKRTIGATLIGALFSLQALADVVVVVNPDNQATITKQDVQRIFLGKKTEFSSGEEATVITQTPTNKLRSEFDRDVLGRSTAQVSAMWAKLVFTGRAIAPQEIETDANVIEFIKGEKNAIGFIDSASVTGDVKVVNLD
ncbi:phosphate ABC transporter substrate-binding protein [Alteromonas sp. 1_MG-2023]|uniref:phosphate ABC transporter substrate-binding protein n=1 Tax=Alteromonas sp. 1_MG-2023 TaxID=3062669 RepID=UPI0026E29733|nr:phosphate ABC transporter substrate-binding protein [Alteromonas sp. 1_MG-2023]MDO6566955.1 phosphate ABC transporter substrate-binding protein [Alteromonas sp. 1_MG-2023]